MISDEPGATFRTRLAGGEPRTEKPFHFQCCVAPSSRGMMGGRGEEAAPVDLTQIRYFLALARTLNFTRAAEACNVTQPALTRSIQRLEEELGGPLLLRERSLSQLTELGRAMLPLLQRTTDAAAAVQARAALHRRQEDQVPLRLGLAPSVPLERLLPPLRDLAERTQGLELSLLRRETQGLADGLLAGEVDIALLPEALPLPERLNRWPLWLERLAVLVPDGHPMTQYRTVTATALAGHTVVTPCDAAALALARLREEQNLRVEVQHVGSGLEEVAALVALGLGLALVPAGTPPPGTISLPLAEPEVSNPVVLAAVAGRPMNRAVSAFVKLVRARCWELAV